MTQSRCDQHQSAVAVREGSDDPGSTSDLADDSLERIVGLDLAPVIDREGKVRERLVSASGDQISSPWQLHGCEFGDDLFVLGSR